MGGTWGEAQLVKCLAIGFGSGHDFLVCGFEPQVGLHADSTEPAWDSLSLSLSLFAPLPKINKLNNKNKKN